MAQMRSIVQPALNPNLLLNSMHCITVVIYIIIDSENDKVTLGGPAKWVSTTMVIKHFISSAEVQRNSAQITLYHYSNGTKVISTSAIIRSGLVQFFSSSLHRNLKFILSAFIFVLALLNLALAHDRVTLRMKNMCVYVHACVCTYVPVFHIKTPTLLFRWHIFVIYST